MMNFSLNSPISLIGSFISASSLPDCLSAIAREKGHRGEGEETSTKKGTKYRREEGGKRGGKDDSERKSNKTKQKKEKK